MRLAKTSPVQYLIQLIDYVGYGGRRQVAQRTRPRPTCHAIPIRCGDRGLEETLELDLRSKVPWVCWGGGGALTPTNESAQSLGQGRKKPN